MGCPVPKIVGNGSGSALMKLPDTAAEICREVVKNANCPVTVKFRAGWDENSINAVEFAKLMEQAGARRRHLSRQDENAVLFRQSRLGYNKAGKRGCEDTRYRKR